MSVLNLIIVLVYEQTSKISFVFAFLLSISFDWIWFDLESSVPILFFCLLQLYTLFSFKWNSVRVCGCSGCVNDSKNFLIRFCCANNCVLNKKTQNSCALLSNHREWIVSHFWIKIANGTKYHTTSFETHTILSMQYLNLVVMVMLLAKYLHKRISDNSFSFPTI